MLSSLKTEKNTERQRQTLLCVVQCPGLISIKVCVTTDPRSWVVGMGQRPPLSIKQRHVTVETGGKQQQDVSELCLAAIDVAHSRQLLEGEWRDPTPHVERPAEGVGRPLLTQRRGELLAHYAVDGGGGDIRVRSTVFCFTAVCTLRLRAANL